MSLIRDMVQDALGITEEESQQLNAWQERQRADREEARKGSVLGSATQNFSNTVREMGEQLNRMDMQAQYTAHRESQMEDAEAFEREGLQKRSLPGKYFEPKEVKKEEEGDFER